MNERELQQSIIENCSSNWAKVAMVAGRVMDHVSYTDEDAFADFFTQAVLRLVEAGRLEARGDVEDWRVSEIRLS